MSKRIIATGAALLLLLTMAGCASTAVKTEADADDQAFLQGLTEREKKILGERTLDYYPHATEAEKAQLREEMMLGDAAWTYLEEKYPGVTFQYQSNSKNQYLYFLVLGDGQEGSSAGSGGSGSGGSGSGTGLGGSGESDSEEMKITVSVEDEDAPTFTDNYKEKLAEPAYEDEMREFFSTYFAEDDFLVDAELEYLDEGDDPLLVRAQANSRIIIKKNKYELLHIMEAMEAYEQKLKESPWPQTCNGGITYLDDDELNDYLDAAPNYSFGLKQVHWDRCSRTFSVVTGTENEGLYLDGEAVVVQDGEVVSEFALRVREESEQGAGEQDADEQGAGEQDT